ncbi:hypothetical protein [Stakelama pacifica]|uniref:Uncharacterized protein n=1 Tax=Stakelama pacifica TaxID=517720 RepID=A0A4R6FYP0_9SPHN|nr:hypothetical protein [Stakelama pacifica]TDN86480.1 hypothetical protein EV664_10149 [Stakelama pacifica]GGO89775.1 hypothetical protein GCM10011329_00510 [Stakelama pacifica]
MKNEFITEGKFSTIALRLVAARFIHKNEDEGVLEIDRIARGVRSQVAMQYLILWAALMLATSFFLIFALAAITLVFVNEEYGHVAGVIALLQFAIVIGILSYWRSLQYGGLTVGKPQPAIYANPEDPAAQNLERLFTELQKESTPRAFYRSRNGVKRYVDERYFFGALRVALVSKNPELRDMFFPPIGVWFSRELFMEVDVSALIVKAKAKPNAAGVKKTYDYTDAAMSLIEHPAIRELDPNKRGSQMLVKGLLHDWYESNRQTPPGETQLALYAKMILDVIRKNRAR